MHEAIRAIAPYACGRSIGIKHNDRKFSPIELLIQGYGWGFGCICTGICQSFHWAKAQKEDD